MQYREFGNTGEKLSILGFGIMRMPTIDNDSSKIDEEKSLQMVRYAIDNGLNYIDTGYPYHGGKSEAFCAKVLKDGYRDKVNIATKSPVWLIKKHEDFEEKLNEQLNNLEVEQIDFYLLHALGKAFWKNMKKNDYKTFLDNAKSSGKVKHIGFSFHDSFELFKEIVDDYDWDFCQIQLNYMDENYQAGLAGLKYAHEKGLGVIIMEPLRGGLLAKDEMPKEVEEIWNSCEVKRTPAQWGLKYLWDYEEVGLVLSGMSTMEQVVENMQTASVSTANSLTQNEKDAISKVKDIYNKKTIVNCTNCKYCLPCPVGVDIPGLFRHYNQGSMFDSPKEAKYAINNFFDDEEKPSNCVECGQCETQCPQNIEIIKHLAIISEKYEEKKE